MEELHEAFILRVKRQSAGKTIPFDKIYFFHKGDQDLFPRIYKDAMVFPITAAFASQISAAATKSYATKAYAFTRFGEHRFSKQLQGDPVDNIVKNRSDYVALIPVLFTKFGSKLVRSERLKGRKKIATFAAYLMARPGNQRTVNLLKKVMSSRSYFLVDGKKIQPLCLVCPRHQYYLQGGCYLGEAQCYQRLARAKPSDMVRGLILYEELMKKMTEPPLDLPEEQKVTS